jgi:hypothetical protein
MGNTICASCSHKFCVGCFSLGCPRCALWSIESLDLQHELCTTCSTYFRWGITGMAGIDRIKEDPLRFSKDHREYMRRLNNREK